MKTVLTPETFALLNAFYDESRGRAPTFSDVELNRVSERPEVLKALIDAGFVEPQFRRITSAGVAALAPYRVQRAVILAAGLSTRCIPLSLEQPKGLFRVKGECLIDRLIAQLHEAGIEDVTVVVGYKQEMFSYLADLPGVRLISNPDYLTCNNIRSLRCAGTALADCYVCPCDDYFAENPFHSFEYRSFYAGVRVDGESPEMFADTDAEGRIVRMDKNRSGGQVLLGHSFWTRDFAEAFLQISGENPSLEREDSYWEWLVQANLDRLPPMYYKRYAARAIVEFDYFDDLRRFDSAYVKHTHSRIVGNIISVFHCDEAEIHSFRKISEGLTNTSFIFRYGDEDYIYRHPGAGTELLVSRVHEKQSLELAKQWGFDPTFVYMDENEGWKISRFVPAFREPDYRSEADSERVLKVLRELHRLPIRTDYGLRPWQEAERIEAALEEKDPGCFAPYLDLKAGVEILCKKTAEDGVAPCFCHGDTYSHNWMLLPDGGTILIDWEYAGFSDPGIDVGYYVVDAAYEPDEARRFIDAYLGETVDETRRFHFMAYVAIIAYYWFVWALYREASGTPMPEARDLWHAMARRYVKYLLG